MVDLDWRHLIAEPSNRTSVWFKTLGDICCTSQGIAHFDLVSSIWWPISENSPTDAKKSRRYLLHKPSYSQFCQNFVVMSVGRGKCDWREHSMTHPRKPPYRWRNLAKISYASRVIANFVPRFVAMATGVGQRKTRLAAFNGPSPNPPQIRAKICRNLVRKPSYSQFCS